MKWCVKKHLGWWYIRAYVVHGINLCANGHKLPLAPSVLGASLMGGHNFKKIGEKIRRHFVYLLKFVYSNLCCFFLTLWPFFVGQPGFWNFLSQPCRFLIGIYLQQYRQMNIQILDACRKARFFPIFSSSPRLIFFVNGTWKKKEKSGKPEWILQVGMHACSLPGTYADFLPLLPPPPPSVWFQLRTHIYQYWPDGIKRIKIPDFFPFLYDISMLYVHGPMPIQLEYNGKMFVEHEKKKEIQNWGMNT